MGDITTQLNQDSADPQRLMALRLHGLHEADRAWLLAQLPEENRQSLQSMLAELTQLGFPQDSALGAVGHETSVRPTPALPVNDAVAVIDAADARAIWSLLRAEPEVVRHYLIGLRAWRWLPELQREPSISPAMLGRNQVGAQVSARTREALLAALARRLADLPPPVQHAAPERPKAVATGLASALAGLLKGIKPWRR